MSRIITFLFPVSLPLYISMEGQDSKSCGTTLSEACSTFNSTWDKIKLNETNIQIITNTNITLSNMDLVPHNDKYLILNITSTAAQPVHVDITDSRLEKIYLQLDNMSIHVTNSKFYSSGIKIELDSNPHHQSIRIENCTFNGASGYPALDVRGRINNTEEGIMKKKEIVVENVEFIGNTAGGIACHYDVMSLINVTMLNNEGQFIYSHHCVIEISSSRLINNSHREEKHNIEESTLTIYDSVFKQNHAPNGGCFQLIKSSLNILNSNFSLNSAENNGGVFRTSNGSVTLTDCLMYNNSAGQDGGAIYTWSSLTINTSTLNHNKAGQAGWSVPRFPHYKYIHIKS